MQRIATPLIILCCLSWLLANITNQTLGEQVFGEKVFGEKNFGGQTQVNTYTTGVQIDSAIAVDDNGRVIVVWSSIAHPNDPILTGHILGQRYDSTGAAIGGEFQIDTATSGVFQTNPSVAKGADGEFAVVWQSYGPDGSDTSSYSVQGRVYDSAGNPVGGQFLINSFTTGTQRAPRVAKDAGHFLVVWESEGSSGDDGSSFSIQGQRFDTSGALQGGEFQANAYTTGSQDNPAITADPSIAGQFLVVWESSNAPGDTSGESVQGRLFDSLGMPLASQFQVNDFTTDSQRRPAATAGSDGEFLVVWDSLESGGDDTDQVSVQGRLVDGNGLPLGGDFQLNAYTTNRQSRPKASSDSAGNFVVVWDSFGSAGDDTSYFSIQGRSFDATVTPLGDEFQVNTYTPGSQRQASVAAASNGEFTVVWQSLGSSGSDNDSYSIQSRRGVIPQDGEVNLIKTGALDLGGDGLANPGDLIAYSFIVTNPSSVTLTSLAVTDPLIGTITCPSGNPIPTLAPSGMETCSGSYNITQADIDAGSRVNTATVSGQSPGGPVEDSDDHLEPIPQDSGLDLLKSGTFTDENGNGEAEVGETIAYAFTLTNTGNVPLTDVTVTDVLIPTISCPSGVPIPTLAPASMEVCTGTYIVTQADLDQGCRVNSATAVGDGPGAVQVMDSDRHSVVLNPIFADGFESGDVSEWSSANGI